MKTTLLFTLLTLFSVNSFSQTTHTITLETSDFQTVTYLTVNVGDVVEFVNNYSVAQWNVIKNGTPVPGYSPTSGTVSVGQVIYQYTFQQALDVTNGVDILAKFSTFVSEHVYFTVVDPSTASVNDLNDDKFTVYPNPTSDYLNLNGDYVESVNVFDMNGRIVLSETTNKVDVSTLQPGVYTLLVNGEQRQRVVVE